MQQYVLLVDLVKFSHKIPIPTSTAQYTIYIYLLAKIGVDTIENERLKDWGVLNIRTTKVEPIEVLPNLQTVATERGVASFFVSDYVCSNSKLERIIELPTYIINLFSNLSKTTF